MLNICIALTEHHFVILNEFIVKSFIVIMDYLILVLKELLIDFIVVVKEFFVVRV